MKAGYIIALTLALVASLPAHASQRDTGAEVYAAEQPRAEKIEITTVENRILVSNAPLGSLLEVYSVVGIKVKEIKIKQPTAEYALDIAKGYYIIRIGDTVLKVAIR